MYPNAERGTSNLFDCARQRIYNDRSRVSEINLPVRELLADFPDNAELPQDLMRIPTDRIVKILEFAGHFVDSAAPKIDLAKLLLDVVYRRGVFNDFRWRLFYCAESSRTGYNKTCVAKGVIKEKNYSTAPAESKPVVECCTNSSEWSLVDKKRKSCI